MAQLQPAPGSGGEPVSVVSPYPARCWSCWSTLASVSVGSGILNLEESGPYGLEGKAFEPEELKRLPRPFVVFSGGPLCPPTVTGTDLQELRELRIRVS